MTGVKQSQLLVERLSLEFDKIIQVLLDGAEAIPGPSTATPANFVKEQLKSKQVKMTHLILSLCVYDGCWLVVSCDYNSTMSD